MGEGVRNPRSEHHLSNAVASHAEDHQERSFRGSAQLQRASVEGELTPATAMRKKVAPLLGIAASHFPPAWRIKRKLRKYYRA